VNQLGAKWVLTVYPLDFAIRLHIQSGNKTKCSIKGGEMDMWLVFYWTGPIGVGIFLVCLGAMIYLIAKADEKSKHTKAFAQEKGLEKKKE
jgi:heme/copper-type cytochrome/quinol oxidase subunit 2